MVYLVTYRIVSSMIESKARVCVVAEFSTMVKFFDVGRPALHGYLPNGNYLRLIKAPES